MSNLNHGRIESNPIFLNYENQVTLSISGNGGSQATVLLFLNRRGLLSVLYIDFSLSIVSLEEPSIHAK